MLSRRLFRLIIAAKMLATYFGISAEGHWQEAARITTAMG